MEDDIHTNELLEKIQTVAQDTLDPSLGFSHIPTRRMFLSFKITLHPS